MDNAVEKETLSLIGLVRGRSRHESYIKTAQTKLGTISAALKQARGFQIIYNHLEEFLAKDWDRESLVGRYTLITKKSLAQKLELNDKIIEITNEQVKIKKATGREWIFLNDRYIRNQKHK